MLDALDLRRPGPASARPLVTAPAGPTCASVGKRAVGWLDADRALDAS
jgi:hypothetical protein